jgi:hypothetical protein
MPLHDWSDPAGWVGVHHTWITELLRWVKPRLPAGYRAYIGSAPLLALNAPPVRPDVGVQSWPSGREPGPSEPTRPEDEKDPLEPDTEVVVCTLDPVPPVVFVEGQGRLVAAVELISPRNKDRPNARRASLARYLGYLLDGAHFVMVDVHRGPLGFSFADEIARELEMAEPTIPPPMAVSYRVGEPAADGGRYLAIWRRPLTVGAPLPMIPLPLTVEQSVVLDLEATYARAAEDAYLT